MNEFSMSPEDQPDRCPSIDPHDTLQCGRRVHEDDQCQFGGIGWRKGSEPECDDDSYELGYGQGWLDAVHALINACESELGGSGLRELLGASKAAREDRCAHHASPNTCHNGVCAACETDPCSICGGGSE